nr:uncharacterized protein LOC129381374 [Dermacentor andersoni]
MKFDMALTLLLLALVPFVDGGGSSPELTDDQKPLCMHEGHRTTVLFCLFYNNKTNLYNNSCEYDTNADAVIAESYWSGSRKRGCRSSQYNHSICACTPWL